MRGVDDVPAGLLADLLGLLVEEHHGDLGPPAGALRRSVDVRSDIGVAQEVIVDVLTAGELLVLDLQRHEDSGVIAIPGVVVGDHREIADPPIHSEQIEGSGTQEEHGRLVGSEEGADLRHVAQSSGLDGSGCGGGHGGLLKRGDGAGWVVACGHPCVANAQPQPSATEIG